MTAAKKLDLHINKLEFTAAPAGSWTHEELSAEVRRRLSRLFLGHVPCEPTFESSCPDKVTGVTTLNPPISVPTDAKSELHPGTLEWAIAKLKKGDKLRRDWWPPGCFAISTSNPTSLYSSHKLNVSDSVVRRLCTDANYPVIVFVDQNRNVSVMGTELFTLIDNDDWEILK